MATVQRGPIVNSIVRKRERFHHFAPSGVLLTLAIVTIAESLVAPVPRPTRPQPEAIQPNRGMLEASPTPFAQSDWPNPIRRIVRQQPDPGGSLLNVTLPVIDLNGGRSDLSFPVDEIKRRQRISDETRPSLLALTTVVVVAPFAQLDWPVPERLTHVRPQLNWRVVADRIPDPPFAQFDWPTPRRPRSIQLSENGPASQVLGTVVTIPFAFYEPQIVERQESLDAHTISSLAYEPQVANPFFLTDWPDRISKREVEVPATSSALTGPVNEAVTFPFAQTEWPIVRKVARFQETPQPNLQGLLYVIPAAPFKQSDWPPAQRRVGRFDYNLTNLLGTLPPPPIPFNQNDWPNPLRKCPPHFDVWGQSLQHTTLFVENVKPFKQDDWNVAFLFAPKPEYAFVSYQPKVIIEGVGLLGLQPPTYVIGTMTTTFGILSAISAIGIGVDGTMANTFAVDGSIDETQGFEGPV